MKLVLNALIFGITLFSQQAIASGGGLSIDLQYGVRDAETLYGVATAGGDLRFVNQGPSAAKVRWFDPLRGAEEARVLGPGQVLVSQGQLGVKVSEGTVVLVEKIGPGPLAAGLASLPSAASMHDSVHCLKNSAFLPWHREFLIPSEGDLPVAHQGFEGALMIGSAPVLGVIWGQTVAKSLEHGPGFHDSVHCLQVANGWLDCPPYEPCDDSYEPAGQVYFALGQNDAGAFLSGTANIWTKGPVSSYWDWSMEPTPYSIWTSGTASIWSDGTSTSIAPDGWVDL